jgi:hypothetical protein
MTQAPDHYTLDDGSERWELDNKLHRDDGPALIFPDGTKTWYRHGAIHRDGGPAVEMAHGTKKWFQNGQEHREDGPAIEYDDGRPGKWYFRGQLHREDGPAMVGEDGEALWFIHGRQLDEAEIAERKEKISADLLLKQSAMEGERAADIIAQGTQQPIKPMKPLKFG